MISKKHIIVDIIPLTRLPSKANDFFSYFSNKEIKPGSIVKIEFKKRKIYGYVWKTYSLEEKRLYLKEEKIYLKPVLEIINQNPVFFSYQLQLAEWLKNYANLSFATSLSYFFPYKNLIFIDLEKIKNKIDCKNNNKTLILVPQEIYLDYLKEKYPQAEIISSKISSKKLSETLKKIINQKDGIFIGTKNSIFLPWQNLSKIIVYQEGSFFYKDFFKQPYLDYRKIFYKFAEINKINLEIEDSLPSFDYLLKTNKIPKIFFNFEKISEKTVEEYINQFKKTILFFPEKLMARKLLCEHCFKPLVCTNCNQNLVFDGKELFCPYCFKKYPLPSICPNCQKETKFFIFKKGAKAYFEYFSKTKKNVYFLEKDDKKIIKEFLNQDSGILIGSLYLMNPYVNADAFFFFNFDEFYYSYNLFLKERFIRILNFFKERTKKIYLVSEIVKPLIETKLKNGEIIEYLLNERKINNLPPYKRLIILKSGCKNIDKLQKELMNLKENLKTNFKNLEIIGPILARPFKIKKRYFLELVLRVENNLNFNLRKILKDVDIEEIDVEALNF